MAALYVWLLLRSGRRRQARWRSPFDGGLKGSTQHFILNEEMECTQMKQRYGRGFSAAEKTELWDRWQRGESLTAIGRAFG